MRQVLAQAARAAWPRPPVRRGHAPPRRRSAPAPRDGVRDRCGRPTSAERSAGSAAAASVARVAAWVAASVAAATASRAACSAACGFAAHGLRRGRAGSTAARPRPAGSRRRCCDSGWPGAPAASAPPSCVSNWPRRSSARARLASAARSFSSASWRRACRPVMPAASSSTARRSSGLAVTSAPTRPWLTIAEACAPGCQIGEQRLHVAGAHLLAVDPVVAAGAALDAPDDLQLGLLVERRRHRAGRSRRA